MEQAITDFNAYYNQEAKPIKWTYTIEKLEMKLEQRMKQEAEQNSEQKRDHHSKIKPKQKKEQHTKDKHKQKIESARKPSSPALLPKGQGETRFAGSECLTGSFPRAPVREIIALIETRS